MEIHVRKYLTLVAAIAGAVAAFLVARTTDGTLTRVEDLQMVIAVATAVGVWIAANVPTLTWAKVAVAVVLGVSQFLVGTIADGLSSADWAQLVVVVLMAAGVWGANTLAPQWTGHVVLVGAKTRDPNQRA
jgi:hypothetical protein